MLEVIDVHTYYGESHILQGVSFKVAGENTTALIGRNGVGKTTTVHSIMGFCRPRRGRILFQGEDMSRLSTHQIAKRGISLVPQGKRLFPSLTVREHLEIAKREGNRERDWDFPRIFQLFPVLEKKMKKRGNMLSGGERQMVAIARALVANPKILLMDEASEGLAPVLVQEVFRVTQELKKNGLAILLVEQKIQAALQVADYAYVMNKGAIVYESTPQKLQNDRTILTKFLGVQASKGE